MAESVSDATRRRILEVAMDEVRRQPVVTVSMATVAERAGITKSSIYKAYANREELFADASRHVLAEQIQEVALDIGPHEDPLDALRDVLIAMFEVGRAQPFAAAHLYGIFPLQFHGRIADHIADGVHDVDREAQARIRSRVAAAVESGQLAGSTEDLTELCIVTSFGYIGGSIHHRWSIEPEALADAVLRSLGA